MDRLNNNTNKGKGKHLNYEKRLKIEALSKAGLKSEAIGAIIGCSGRKDMRNTGKQEEKRSIVQKGEKTHLSIF